MSESASVFSIQLSKQQKRCLTDMLPRGYSFQPYSSSIPKFHEPKHAPVRKFSIPKEDTVEVKEQKEDSVQKRRKIKSYESLESEKRSSLGKKEQINRLVQIVKKLKKSELSWPFRVPVNTKSLAIPNYFSIVQNPMDLQTIQEKIKLDKYEHPSQIQRDLNQIFLNSYKFNPKNDRYFTATLNLQSYYYELLKESEQKLLKQSEEKKELPQRQKKKQQNNNHTNALESEKSIEIQQFQKQIGSIMKRATQQLHVKVPRSKPIYFSSKNEVSLTLKQKRELAQDIRSLSSSQLSRVYQIIRLFSKEGRELTTRKMDEDVEILGVDIEKLDQKTLRELQNYIRFQRDSEGLQGSVDESKDFVYELQEH